MSLVVNNGFKTDFNTIEDVVSWSKTIRPKIIKLADGKFYTLVARNFLATISQIYSGKCFPAYLAFDYCGEESEIDLNYMLYPQVVRATEKSMINHRQGMMRNPVYDFHCSIVFIPFEGIVYATLHADTKEFIDTITNNKHFEEFWYDGRTDAFGEMTEEEYEVRGAIWGKIFKNYFAPVEVGLSLDFIPNLPCCPDRNKIFKIIKDEYDLNYETMIAGRFLVEEWEHHNEEWAQEQAKLGHHFHIYDAFNKWQKTEEGQSIFEKLLKQHKEAFPSKDSMDEFKDLSAGEVFKKITGEKYESGTKH